MIRLFCATLGVTAVLTTFGCSSSDDKEEQPAPTMGTEGAACYPNGTCDAGLSCLSALCVAAGAGGSGSTNGGSSSGTGPTAGAAQGGTGGVGGTGETECFTRDVTNSAASEKVNAAFCFGIPIDDLYSCSFNATANETRCIGAKSSYVVVYSETDNGTVGDIYDLDGGEHLGTVIQAATGQYEIASDGGVTGSCIVNGDIATLCIDP